MSCTPTANSSIALKLGGFANTRSALDYAATGETGVNFHDIRRGRVNVMSYRDLRERALAAASGMAKLGLSPGERIGLVADTSADFLVLFYGAQYAGVVACTLPYQVLPGGRQAYTQRLRSLHKASGARWLLAPSVVMTCAEEAVGRTADAIAFEAFLESCCPGDEGPAIRLVGADIPAYVQFSSGSTSEPKGVVVRQQALMANANAIACHGLRIQAADRACSWLPFCHDMGLVGFSVVAMCCQRSVDYLSPYAFAASPLSWLKLMSEQATTIVYAPSFAWRLAARRCRGTEQLDLRLLRIAGVGGDRVRIEDLDAFVDVMSVAGFRREAFQPSYGLAEATLAVTMGDTDLQPIIDYVNIEERGEGFGVALPRSSKHSAQQTFVSAGRPLPGIDVHILDQKDRQLPERTIGKLWVRGPAVAQAYQGKTDAPLPRADGFLDTGDLGYMFAGELFVTGRAKEVILLRGHNVWPQDVERVAANAVRADETDVAAIGLERDGGEKLVVLVQGQPVGVEEQERIRRTLVAAIATAFGATPEVILLRNNSLPYTSSGKLARVCVKAMYLEGRWLHSSQMASENVV